MDNYLPAHAVCNNYRWFYGAQECQWILKLGVWLRTQIERKTSVGRMAATAFCAHERARASRSKVRFKFGESEEQSLTLEIDEDVEL